MNFQKYRPFLFFIVIVVLFFLNIFFSTYLFMTWDKPPSSSKNFVEVSLPVIDWQSYSRLSKKWKNGNVDSSQ